MFKNQPVFPSLDFRHPQLFSRHETFFKQAILYLNDFFLSSLGYRCRAAAEFFKSPADRERAAQPRKVSFCFDRNSKTWLNFLIL